MPITFRDLMRSRTVAAHRAADFGADKPFNNDGTYWTQEQCDAMTQCLVGSGFREDIMITIEPLARSILALARDGERLMIRFADWWGRRNRVVLDEGVETLPTAIEPRETGWFRFFLVVAAVEAGHGNHGHIVVADELTEMDEHMLKKFAKRLGLRVIVTRNSDEWLADKKGVPEHSSKVEYAVDHLRSGGSDFRASASRMTEPETQGCTESRSGSPRIAVSRH
jgi:hypothetical protein